MRIDFTTDVLDEKLYQKLILKYIYDHYYYKDYERIIKQDKWKISIRKTSDYDHQFYSSDPRAQDLDFSIPHGVTGLGEITCYVTDSKNNPVSYTHLTLPTKRIV